uniref:Uncharacterized protein n=1 Tax=Knipowitschia caucasica TaxID=637954 RepID=A0AAV2L181_KNICA
MGHKVSVTEARCVASVDAEVFAMRDTPRSALVGWLHSPPFNPVTQRPQSTSSGTYPSPRAHGSMGIRHMRSKAECEESAAEGR